jgi:hypothetical protein
LMQSLHETAVSFFTKKPDLPSEPVSTNKLSSTPLLAARTQGRIYVGRGPWPS